MERKFFEGAWQRDRSFSRAVTTRGGRMIWLAGHGGFSGEAGKTYANDFPGQTRQAFHNLAATLEMAGGKLADIVTMTVFIIDARYGDEFVEIRKEFFPDGNYPGSALITCAGFAHPQMMVEIQGIAVVDD